MGLKDWKRDAIEAAAIWYGKDWLRRALAGEKGPEMQALAQWLVTNKLKIGGFMVFLSGMLTAGMAQNIFKPSEGMLIFAFVVSYTGVYLVGGGSVKSDKDQKALLAFKASGIDRRKQLAPPEDLLQITDVEDR